MKKAKMDTKQFFAAMAIIILIAFPAPGQSDDSPPDVPCRIGGTLKVNGELVTNATDGGYVIMATRQDMTPFKPPAKDEDGLNDFNWYHVDVPLYEPDGVSPGETIILHVYHDGSKLLVTSPAGGYVTVIPQENHTIEIHLEAISSPKIGSRMYTEDEFLQAVRNFDVNADGRVGLPEAIHALRVMSGL